MLFYLILWLIKSTEFRVLQYKLFFSAIRYFFFMFIFFRSSFFYVNVSIKCTLLKIIAHFYKYKFTIRPTLLFLLLHYKKRCWVFKKTLCIDVVQLIKIFKNNMNSLGFYFPYISIIFSRYFSYITLNYITLRICVGKVK